MMCGMFIGGLLGFMFLQWWWSDAPKAWMRKLAAIVGLLSW